MSRKRTLHMFEKKEWHPETLEMQRRARKLILDHGYPEAKNMSAAVDVSHNLRVYYYDRTLTVSFHGDQVYLGHDDTGPWFRDEPLRDKIHEALLVLRSYMVLNDLADV